MPSEGGPSAEPLDPARVAVDPTVRRAP